MGPSLNRYEREANRLFNAELLDQQLRELSRGNGNVKPQAGRFKKLPCMDPMMRYHLREAERRRERAIVTKELPRADPVSKCRVPDEDCSRNCELVYKDLPCTVAQKECRVPEDCSRSCAISTDSSEDGLDSGSEHGEECKPWAKIDVKTKEQFGYATRRSNLHGPMIDGANECKLQKCARTPDLLPKTDELDEVEASSPVGRKSSKESLTDSQRTRNAMYLKRHAVAQGPLPGDNDSEKIQLMPEIPWELHPNRALTRRAFIRKDSQQDGKWLETIPRVDIGESRLLLPNVLARVQYAHGRRPPVKKRMRLEGDEDSDSEQPSDEECAMGPSALGGEEKKTPNLQTRNFWLGGLSTLAGWIFHMR